MLYNLKLSLNMEIYRSVEELIKDPLQQREETEASCDGNHQGAGILIGGGLPLLQTCECPEVVTLLHLESYESMKLDEFLNNNRTPPKKSILEPVNHKGTSMVIVAKKFTACVQIISLRTALALSLNSWMV